LFFISINVFSANEIEEEKTEEQSALDTKILSLNKDIDHLSNKQQKLNEAIERSRTIREVNVASSANDTYATIRLD
jgi:hypothetical protein